MSKEMASLLIGIGVEIIVTIFGVVVKKMPMPLAIAFGVIGLGLIVYGLVSLIRGIGNKKQGQEVGIPQLELSDPISVPSQTEIVEYEGKTWNIQVDLWRVRLTNIQPDSQALNIRVQIVKSNPPISILPVSVHRKHDNTLPYEQSWTLRYGEPIEFDVIGYQCLAYKKEGGSIGTLYIYRSDSGRNTIPFEVPGRETAEAMAKYGIVLTIGVFVDLPAQGISRDYRVLINSKGTFVLEAIAKQVPDKEDSRT
jgi:hypothetical protein